MSLCYGRQLRPILTHPQILSLPPHIRLHSTIIHPPAIQASFQDGASYHWDTPPPTPAQLQRAAKLYQSAPPKLLFSTTTFRTVHESALPEVAFFGRSNVGKSSLLNALMGRNICHTSSKPGRTRSMNFFAVGGEDGRGNAGRLAVLDMPGYGKGSHAEWGAEIEKYLKGRKQLKRAFLLIDALHGLKRTDEEILSLFRKRGVPHQVILSKVDRVLFPKLKKVSVANIREKIQQNQQTLARVVEDLRARIQPGLGDGPEALGEVITCSAETVFRGGKFGVDDVRWATMAATGLGDEKKWSVNSMLKDSSGNNQPRKIVSEQDLIVEERV